VLQARNQAQGQSLILGVLKVHLARNQDLQVYQRRADLVVRLQCGQEMESLIIWVNVYVIMDKHMKFLHVTPLNLIGAPPWRPVYGKHPIVVLLKVHQDRNNSRLPAPITRKLREFDVTNSIFKCV